MLEVGAESEVEPHRVERVKGKNSKYVFVKVEKSIIK